MPVWAWILIILAVLVVIAIIAWLAWSRQRTQSLQRRFGPEYDRTVEQADSRREAESDLVERRKRRESIDIRPLSPAARERYAREWSQTQAKFVDSPSDAIREADALVSVVMRERGYPMESFDQQAADISVDHPDVVENYRHAHRVSQANDEGRASTEDLRRAMKNYRSLFDSLLDDGRPADAAEAR